MLDVFKKENGKIVIYTKKKVTQYLMDFKNQIIEFGGRDDFIYADLLEEAQAMGRKNMRALMADFYNYPIIPVWDI